MPHLYGSCGMGGNPRSGPGTHRDVIAVTLLATLWSGDSELDRQSAPRGQIGLFDNTQQCVAISLAKPRLGNSTNRLHQAIAKQGGLFVEARGDPRCIIYVDTDMHRSIAHNHRRSRWMG